MLPGNEERIKCASRSELFISTGGVDSSLYLLVLINRIEVVSLYMFDGTTYRRRLYLFIRLQYREYKVPPEIYQRRIDIGGRKERDGGIKGGTKARLIGNSKFTDAFFRLAPRPAPPVRVSIALAFQERGIPVPSISIN